MAAACAPWLPAAAAPGPTGGRFLDPAALARADAALAAAVAEGRIPGAVLRIEREGTVHQRAIGRKGLQPVAEALSEDTVYDAASLTKAVCTAPLVMQLAEGGVLDLEAPIKRWLPAFDSHDAITARHLLTHTSGLPAGLPLAPDWTGHEAALALACTRQVTHPPGSFFRYSDVNFILLGEIAQRVAGQPLQTLAQQRLFGPLGMADSGFLPLQGSSRMAVQRIAPTEIVAGGVLPLRGEVHDPTARRMGGVAGHAGLFTTAADLARYARMLMNNGLLDGVRVLQPATVARMTQVGTPPGLPERRSLGFDIDSPFSRARGKVFPIGSYGHTGFTGCVLWVDPFSRCFHVLLSNRVHPRTRDPIVALYEEVGTLAAQAVTGFDFSNVPGALPAR